jgi:hypothetical protein
MTKRNKKEDEDEDEDEVVVVGSRQTMKTRGNYNRNTKSNRNDEADDNNTNDDNTDDDGVTDLRESMPVLTLPDTQSLMERLGEQNSRWDDCEDDEDDKEIKKSRRKAEAQKQRYHSHGLHTWKMHVSSSTYKMRFVFLGLLQYL